MKTQKFKVSTPKFSIPSTPEAVVLFVRGTTKVQDIVKLYGHVAMHKLDDIIEHKFENENLTMFFRKEGREVIITNANYIVSNRYEIHFKPSIHFLSRMVERGFDMNVFIPLYQFVSTQKINDEEVIELDTGKTTIVFVKYDKTIKLLTAWPGSRDNEPHEDLRTSA